MADVTVAQLLDRHVRLDLDCLDRIYLNAYVPNLQVGGQVVSFMTEHLGQPIPSPAVLAKLGDRFRAAVTRFCDEHDVPMVRFDGQQRQIDAVRPFLDGAVGPGVVAVGVAQEFQSVFTAFKRRTDKPGAVCFGFAKADRRVTNYYFYVVDAEFGPGFIKLCSYFPYPGKGWVNGHEWAKRQAAKAGLGFEALANGFEACDDPARLQRICDRLGARHIQAFFERWMKIIPAAVDPGPQGRLLVGAVDAPDPGVPHPGVRRPPTGPRLFRGHRGRQPRHRRPDEVKLIFGRQIRTTTKGEFATKVVTRGTDVTVNVFYKHSRIKEYLKEGRALRMFADRLGEDGGDRVDEAVIGAR